LYASPSGNGKFAHPGSYRLQFLLRRLGLFGWFIAGKQICQQVLRSRVMSRRFVITIVRKRQLAEVNQQKGSSMKCEKLMAMTLRGKLNIDQVVHQ
jgi:hypothetical protein